MVPGQQLSVTAVFEIGADGRFTVRLSSGSGDPRLDELALKTLRTWRWRPKVSGRQTGVQPGRVEGGRGPLEPCLTLQ